MSGRDVRDRTSEAGEPNPLPHFATDFILGCAKALIAAGLVPEDVTPHRVVYRRGQLRLAAAWDPARRALDVRLGHRRGAGGEDEDHAPLGWRYNLLLEAAGIPDRLPEAFGEGAGVQDGLTDAVRLVARTLPDLVDRYRKLEPRTRALARRPPAHAG